MRVLLVVAVLLLVMAAGCAHDAYCGLMDCYGTGHCVQNKCIFGIIVGQNATEYTLHVTKTLRGWDVAGQWIRIRNGGWQELYHGTDTPLTIGDAIVISYSSNTPQPYQPLYMVRSATSDWRKMTVPNGSSCTRAEIDPFVRSGGKIPPLSWFGTLVLLFGDRAVAFAGGLLLFVIGVIGFVLWRRALRQRCRVQMATGR